MGFIRQLTNGRHLWKCNRCETLQTLDGDKQPAGYHVIIKRVYNARNSPDTIESAWFCDKDCMMEGIRYHNYG